MQEFLGVLGVLHEVKRNKLIHVEHAMAIMLKRHGVVIPINDFKQLAKDFQPSDKGYVNQEKPVAAPLPAAANGNPEFELPKN